MQKIGILGYGEIGKAIAKFYQKPFIKDFDKNDFIKNLDVLHICIPYIDNFKEIVLQNIKDYNPKLIIIHSTVSVGITKELFKKYKNIVHSPVRGVHPKLYEGIKTFIKYVGADDEKIGMRAVKHFKSIGIKAKYVEKSATTELAKLLDTTYYGVCIAFHQFGDDLCKKYNLDFDKVMTEFNKSYNAGYSELNKKNVIRPVLYPPKGKIGGHCIISNVKILKKIVKENNILNNILNL